MTSVALGQVVVQRGIRKTAEYKPGSKTVSSTPLWSLLQLLPPALTSLGDGV